ncbi:Cna B-type domain-containing protein [Olsenella sp. AGMB03486]|uniref:Cna B-type domain-containing protein n=1 Tax=Olsenella sp. AGMB03486 TaxID=3230364 RepID=UPI0034A0055E
MALATPSLAAAETVSNPIGSTMNVFDYWIDFQTEDDSKWDTTWTSPANRGINANHKLKFHRYDRDVNATKGDLNSYLGGSVVNQGIVANTLGSDGYPVLSQKNGGESLAYLFNPAVPQNGKASYTDATYLFQQDADGYYFYDSSQYWAKLDKNSKQFTVSELPAGASHDIYGANEATYYGFFPFDPEIKPQYHSTSRGNYHNHYFGVTMTTPFTQPYGGMVEKSDGTLEPMKFEFSGDDDVWVYIDGVLVGDLGGIHGVSTLDIDFRTGEVTIGDVGSKGQKRTYTLRELYSAAGKEGAVAWNGNTFADYSSHKMNFFYMERGNQLSNMKIKYNLVGGGSISAKKTLTSGGKSVALRQGQFQYELRGYYDDKGYDDKGNAPVMPIGIPKSPVAADETGSSYTSATVGCAADGSVNFGAMQLGAKNAGKTYRYSVREVVPADATDNHDGTFTQDGVVYDGHVHYLEASVKQETDGSYTVQKTWYSDSGFTKKEGSGESYVPAFANSYKSGNSIDLKVQKTLVGDALEKDAFAFVLKDSDGTQIGTATNGEDGIAHFKVSGFHPADFGYKDGTIKRTYTISEQVPEGAKDNGDGTYTKDGIVYASKPVTVYVKGTYSSKAAGDPITVTTSYDQGTLSAAYEGGRIIASTSGITGTATIEPITDGAPMSSSASVQIGADGKADFGTVDFSKADAGKYKYRVSAGSHVAELAVTIGSHETAIVPSFVQDEGRPSGTLSAKATGLGGTATISASEGAPLPQKSSAEVDEKGKVSFGTVDFSAAAAGTYTYTITVGGKTATVKVTVSKETQTASGVSGSYALTFAGNGRYFLHVTANVGTAYNGQTLALSPSDNMGWARATAKVTNGVADFGYVEWWDVASESHSFTIRTSESWNYTTLGSFTVTEPNHGPGTSGNIGAQATTVTKLTSKADNFSETTSDITAASHEIAVAADIPTITNRAVVEVHATKVWNDGNADPKNHPEVTFHLLQKVRGAKPTRVEGQDRTIKAGATGDGLTVIWRNLPKRDADGNVISYSVEEETLPGYSSEIKGSASDGFTVTNTPSFGFSLLKKGVAADGSAQEGPLPGAKFTIQTADSYVMTDGSLSKDKVELTTGNDGTIFISNKLHPGTYTITETAAPQGYQLPKGKMTLVIKGDGSAEFTSLSGTESTIKTNEKGQFSITVTDVKAVGSLPVTGSIGDGPLFLLGVAAIAWAVVRIGLWHRS